MVILRVISIVFLFFVRLRFSSNLSTIQVIRNRYGNDGNDTVKLVRQFEKLDYKYRKLLLDLNFLENCIRNNVTPKFVQFCLADRGLEIINKKRCVILFEKDLSSVKNEVMLKLKWIDFHHVWNLFLVVNDKSISKHQNIKDRKFCKLSNSVIRDLSYDPEQVIHNFSSHILNEAE